MKQRIAYLKSGLCSAQGGPSGCTLPFGGLQIKNCILVQAYCAGTFVLMSTKGSVQPDGPPCIAMFNGKKNKTRIFLCFLSWAIAIRYLQRSQQNKGLAAFFPLFN